MEQNRIDTLRDWKIEITKGNIKILFEKTNILNKNIYFKNGKMAFLLVNNDLKEKYGWVTIKGYYILNNFSKNENYYNKNVAKNFPKEQEFLKQDEIRKFLNKKFKDENKIICLLVESWEK